MLSNRTRSKLPKQWADEARDITPWLSSKRELALLGELSCTCDTFIGFQVYLFRGEV